MPEIIHTIVLSTTGLQLCSSGGGLHGGRASGRRSQVRNYRKDTENLSHTIAGRMSCKTSGNTEAETKLDPVSWEIVRASRESETFIFSLLNIYVYKDPFLIFRWLSLMGCTRPIIRTGLFQSLQATLIAFSQQGPGLSDSSQYSIRNAKPPPDSPSPSSCSSQNQCKHPPH